MSTLTEKTFVVRDAAGRPVGNGVFFWVIDAGADSGSGRLLKGR